MVRERIVIFVTDRLISEHRFVEDLYGCLDECDFELKDVVDVLKGVESVDATPIVHGHWIKVKDVCGISILKCSICGIDRPREATAYCCDCGAKMKPNFIA